MSKAKSAPAIVVDNGGNDVSVRFYISDASSGSKPRVVVSLLSSGVPVYSADHAISEYSTITPQQKASLLSILTAIRDETLTLEGFV